MRSSQKREKPRAPIGVGIDLEDVHRFAVLDQKKDQRFLHRIFTPAERTYCFRRANAGQHLAGRFAAKEAVKKALHSVGLHRVSYRDIEISNDAHGAPRVRLAGTKRWRIALSMSHSVEVAVAIAIITARL